MSNFNLPSPSVPSGERNNFVVRKCFSRSINSGEDDHHPGLKHLESSTRIGSGSHDCCCSQHLPTQTSEMSLQFSDLSIHANCDPGYMRSASDVELLRTGSNVTGYQRTPSDVMEYQRVMEEVCLTHSESQSKQVPVANGQYVVVNSHDSVGRVPNEHGGAMHPDQISSRVNMNDKTKDTNATSHRSGQVNYYRNQTQVRTHVGPQAETFSTGFNACGFLPPINGHVANGNNSRTMSTERLPGGVYRGGKNSPRGGVPGSYTKNMDTQEISGEVICSGTVVKEEHIQNLRDRTGQHGGQIDNLISNGAPVRNHSITSGRVLDYDNQIPVGTIANRNARATALRLTPPQGVPAPPHSSRAARNRAMFEKQIARRTLRNRTPPTPPNGIHNDVYANPNYNDANGIYVPPTAARRQTCPRTDQPGANEIDPSTGNPITGERNAVSPRVFPNRGSTPHTNPTAPPSLRAPVSNPQRGNRADPFSVAGFGGLVSVEAATDAMGRSLSMIRNDRSNPSPLGFADIPNPLLTFGTHEIAEPLSVNGECGIGEHVTPVGFQGIGQPS